MYRFSTSKLPRTSAKNIVECYKWWYRFQSADILWRNNQPPVLGHCWLGDMKGIWPFKAYPLVSRE